MNDEVSKIYRYTFISKFKVLSIKVYIFTSFSHRVSVFLRLTVVFLCLPIKKAIRSYLMILKCSLAIWQLRSLTVEISDVPCTGKVVSLSPDRLAPFDFFWKPNPSSRKASI